MELVVVAPRLLALPAATLQTSSALARVAAWATRASAAAGIDAATLAAARIDGAAVATLVARASGGASANTVADGGWLVADPVTLAAGRDDVVVTARVDDLDPLFIARILALLNRHFAADAMTFTAPHPDRWLVHLAARPDATFVAPDVALGGSLYAHRPQGRDARRFECHANEIQMLLHDAAENDARERAGLSPFNALWLWGGAAGAPFVQPLPRIDAHAPPGSAGDLARGAALASGGVAQGLGERLDLVDRSAEVMLVVLPPITADTFAQVDATWLAPAVDALAGHAITQLTLVADGAGVGAIRWTANAPSWLLRLRARVAAARFGVAP